MSLEEDTELRDLVVKCLESNGILPKLKAQLRASVFLALEEEDAIKDKIPLRNPQLHDFLKDKKGKLLFLLIKDLFDHFNLEYTRSVFEAEANVQELMETDMNKIFTELDINIEQFKEKKRPLIFNLLLNFIKSNKSEETTRAPLEHEQNTSSECVTPKPITEIRTTVKNINNKTYIKINSDLSPHLSDISYDESSVSSNTPDSKHESHAENISEKTSSIVEEDIEQGSDETIENENYLIDFDKSIQQTSSPIAIDNNQKHILDETITNNDGTITNKEIIENETLSIVERNEKTKPLSSLSSLQDLPPLNTNLNKTRTESILLPSLYVKKEKKNNLDSQSDETSND